MWMTLLIIAAVALMMGLLAIFLSNRVDAVKKLVSN